MKPEQFIREFGLPEAKRILEEAPKHSQFVIPCLDGEMYFSQREDDGKWFKWSTGYSKWLEYFGKCNPLDLAYSLSDLKRLVESLDFVETCGGIDSCRKKLSTRDECKPNATHFAIHPEKPHLIQMYRRNEPKLMPNYSFAELKKAVAAHESIYGGGDEAN